MIYPQKINSKKGDKIVYSLIAVSIAIAVTLFIINKLTTPQIHWAALANCGILYTWLTVIYSIKRGTNIAGHVLIQTVLVSIVLLYIDKTIGYHRWAIYIGIPITLMVANITMVILTIISHERYIKYAIYQLLIVIISVMPIALALANIIEMNVLMRIAVDISVFSLVSSFVLCYKDIKEAIIRKMHM
jgi:hypothetical protein